jgi:hypothetical protein
METEQLEPKTTACGNTDHEHMDEFDRDGELLDCPAPMTCHHCGRPSHYDFSVEDYAHDDDSTCFLSGPNRSACI